MTFDFKHVRYERRSSCIALLTLDRPQSMNAIDPLMMEEIGQAVITVEQDPDVVVLIVTGEGEKAFSSGLDLRAFKDSSLSKSPLQPSSRRFASRHPFETMTKPIVAAVNGLAFGGGLELALLSDIVIAADHATFAAKEVSRGLIPGNGATQRLPRRIGMMQAMEMILTASVIDAEKALNLGLVNRVVPIKGLLEEAERIGSAIAANGPVAVRLAKEAMLRGIDVPLTRGLEIERDLSNLVHQTEDAKEGIRSFIERRPPNWIGK
jgi:enoyl-CoA hydratase/carnithine racemase